ncbi:MAG TPA: RsmG family class I SAM-dependent methyltransferase, partial [Candidatus Polarisedimenticolia bacterium]|nr:RsmG family class I SAM-dependent methyltransferase [Candidatus Polarisedimenticolia bacterium]
MKWATSQRLVASQDPAWIAESLIADSLLFLKLIPGDARTLLDVGSGAGIPGIPIKIVRPEIAVTLLDSRLRRASFLRAVVRELQLVHTEVVDQRLEALSA